jgi:hypothetical protein
MNLRCFSLYQKMDQLIPNDIWIEIVSCLTENDFATLRAIFRLNKAINARIVLFMNSVHVEYNSNDHWFYKVLANGIKHGPACLFVHKCDGINGYFLQIDKYFWGRRHGKSYISRAHDYVDVYDNSLCICRYFEGHPRGLTLNMYYTTQLRYISFIITRYHDGRVRYIIGGTYSGDILLLYKTLKKHMRLNLSQSKVRKLLEVLPNIEYRNIY